MVTEVSGAGVPRGVVEEARWDPGPGAVQIILPTLVKPEVASAVRRPTGQPALAATTAAAIDALGDAILVTLDEEQKRRLPDGMAALYPSEALDS